LGHKCCQREIFRQWNKGFRCNKTKFFLSFFLFLPVFSGFFVCFDHHDEFHFKVSRQNSMIDSDEDEEMEIPFVAHATMLYLCILSKFFRVHRPATELWRLVREQLSTIRQQKSVTFEEVHSVERPEATKKHCFSKPFIFYSAPVSKFTWHTVRIIVTSIQCKSCSLLFRSSTCYI
jgi:hypothetical protein